MDLLNVAKAWEMLHDPRVTRNLDTEAYMGLCEQAGYGVDAVQAAGQEWGLKRLRAGLML